mgnify:CR=1 FL=1
MQKHTNNGVNGSLWPQIHSLTRLQSDNHQSLDGLETTGHSSLPNKFSNWLVPLGRRKWVACTNFSWNQVWPWRSHKTTVMSWEVAYLYMLPLMCVLFNFWFLWFENRKTWFLSVFHDIIFLVCCSFAFLDSLLLLLKVLPQLSLGSKPFPVAVDEVDVKSACRLSLLALDNLQ